MSGDKGFIYKVERFNLLSGKFWVCAGVLALVAIIVLNYFNIYSPSFLSFLPRKEVVTIATKNIGFASEVQGYTLGAKNNNHKVLIESLDRLGFWGKKQSASVVKTSTVLILLAGNKTNMVDFKDKEGKVLFSYSRDFSKDAVIIKIYVEDVILQKDSVLQEVGKYLGFIFETMVVEKSLSAEKSSILKEIQNNIILTKDEQLIGTEPSIIPTAIISSNSAK